MTHEFSAQVRKIVDNYLDRLRVHLKGLPEADREELVREIYSHIFESYAQDSTDDDIQRILNVLDRLGEPAEVVASRLSGTMKRMGKRRNLPLYILAGFFIGIFGLPLGAGGLALMIGLGITLLALIFTYFVTDKMLARFSSLSWEFRPVLDGVCDVDAPDMSRYIAIAPRTSVFDNLYVAVPPAPPAP